MRNEVGRSSSGERSRRAHSNRSGRAIHAGANKKQYTLLHHNVRANAAARRWHSPVSQFLHGGFNGSGDTVGPTHWIATAVVSYCGTLPDQEQGVPVALPHTLNEKFCCEVAAVTQYSWPVGRHRLWRSQLQGARIARGDACAKEG